MSALLALGGWLKGQSEWLVLLVVAGIGAYFYVQHAHVRDERDDYLQFAELVCAAAGQPYAASAVPAVAKSGKTVVVRHGAGALCRRKVTELAAFRADTIKATADTLAEAMRDQAERQTNDTAAARAAALAARDAAQAMEKADAEAERRNLVDADWFRAVNGVAGLRAPQRR